MNIEYACVDGTTEALCQYCRFLAWVDDRGTGFSREEACTYAASLSSEMPPSRINPVPRVLRLLRDSAVSVTPHPQCNFILGSVPLPMRLPSINIKVRKVPYSAIWCMRYRET